MLKSASPPRLFKAVALLLFLCAWLHASDIKCNGSDGPAIQASLSSGSPTTLTGACNIGGTVLSTNQNGTSLTSTTGATLLHTGGGYAIQSPHNGLTITGIAFNGGGIHLTGGSQSTGQSGFVFRANSIANVTDGSEGIHVDNIIGRGGPHSYIDGNAFSNIWQGGYPNGIASDYNALNGAGVLLGHGFSDIDITNNTFDEISNDGLHGFGEYFVGVTYNYVGKNVLIKNNKFTRGHRINMEFQGTGNAALCPGGCGSYPPSWDGIIVQGNYSTDFSGPSTDQFGVSLMFGSLNTQLLNNTQINTTTACSYPPGIGFEYSMNGGLAQGNVTGSILSACKGSYYGGVSLPSYGYATYAISGATKAGYVNTLQNNIWCGPNATTQNYQHEPFDGATYVYRYDYSNEVCTGLRSGIAQPLFTSASGQSLANGATGTFSVNQVSTLSLKNMSFYLDNSAAPAVVQEIQDVNSGFTANQAWQYHAAIPITGLASGPHSIKAVATDVSDATNFAVQVFTVTGSVGGNAGGGTVTVIAPPVVVPPAPPANLGTWTSQTSGPAAMTLALAGGILTVTGTATGNGAAYMLYQPLTAPLLPATAYALSITANTTQGGLSASISGAGLNAVPIALTSGNTTQLIPFTTPATGLPASPILELDITSFGTGGVLQLAQPTVTLAPVVVIPPPVIVPPPPAAVICTVTVAFTPATLQCKSGSTCPVTGSYSGLAVCK